MALDLRTRASESSPVGAAQASAEPRRGDSSPLMYPLQQLQSLYFGYQSSPPPSCRTSDAGVSLRAESARQLCVEKRGRRGSSPIRGQAKRTTGC